MLAQWRTGMNSRLSMRSIEFFLAGASNVMKSENPGVNIGTFHLYFLSGQWCPAQSNTHNSHACLILAKFAPLAVSILWDFHCNKVSSFYFKVTLSRKPPGGTRDADLNARVARVGLQTPDSPRLHLHRSHARPTPTLVTPSDRIDPNTNEPTHGSWWLHIQLAHDYRVHFEQSVHIGRLGSPAHKGVQHLLIIRFPFQKIGRVNYKLGWIRAEGIYVTIKNAMWMERSCGKKSIL